MDEVDGVLYGPDHGGIQGKAWEGHVTGPRHEACTEKDVGDVKLLFL